MIALYFLLLAAPPVPAGAPASAAAPASATAPSTAGIEMIVPGHYRVNVGQVGAQEWARQARIVPAHKDGVVRGFKLFGIRRGSLFGALGFANGDIVVAIAGRPIKGMEDALTIYNDLRTAKSVDVTVDRRGTPLTLKYDLTGMPPNGDAFLPPELQPPGPTLDVVGQLDGKLDFSLGEGAGGEGAMNLALVDGQLKLPDGPIVRLGRITATVSLKADDGGLGGKVETLVAQDGDVSLELQKGGVSLPWTRRRGTIRLSLEVVVKFDAATSPLRLLPGAVDGRVRLECEGPVPAVRCRPRI